MADIKLKRCPFCGGNAQIKMIGNDYILATHKLTARSKTRCGCEISCSNFGCSIKVTVLTLHPPLEQTREWAAARWNARAPDPLLEQMAKVLEAVQLQLLQSNNQTEYAEEANNMARAVLAAYRAQHPEAIK